MIGELDYTVYDKITLLYYLRLVQSHQKYVHELNTQILYDTIQTNNKR